MAFGRMTFSRMTEMRAALGRIECHVVMSVIFQQGVILPNVVGLNVGAPMEKQETEPW
jgi:hypothetical protein